MKQLFATVGLFGASAVALTQASGKAIVVNKCSYSVNLDNVPAANQGGTAESKTLAPGETYWQYYTGLEAPHDGWSIKLSPVDDQSGQVIQFEYTYLPTNPLYSDIIWFDMSFVNGDPFDNNWKFSSNAASCQSSLTHAAYMFSTDNAFGMQKPCSCTDDVILTTCEMPDDDSSSSASSSTSSSGGLLGDIASGVGGLLGDVLGGSSAPSTTLATSYSSAPVASTSSAPAAPAVVSSAAPAPTTTAAVSSSSSSVSVPPAPTTAPATAGHAVEFAGFGAFGDEKDANINAAADSMADSMDYAHTVTEVETAYVNVYTTVQKAAATPAVQKRHAHHLHRHRAARNHA